MRLLHTSDWHLGLVLHNYDRTEEGRDALRQLARIVQHTRPDLMIVSGDIYNVSSPTISAQKVFTEGLLSICQSHPDMQVIVTAGNHDSAMRLEINHDLWIAQRVHVVGSLTAEPDKHIVCLPGVAIVVAIPYFNPRYTQTKDIVIPLLERAKELNGDALPIIMTAHAAITGADISGHEDNVGGTDFTSLTEWGEGYDYFALGHLHRPQTLKNSDGKTRYCGSLIPISFSEKFPHGVDIIEIRHGESPIIETYEIVPSRELVDIPTGKPKAYKEVLEILANFDPEKDCYIRLNVLADNTLLPDIKERAQEILRHKKCKLCLVNTISLGDKQSLQTNATITTLQEFQKLSPIDVAQKAYKTKYDVEMSSEEIEMMGQIFESCNTDEI